MQHSVSIRDLSLNFGNVKVLEHLNLDIAQGEFIVLLGPSGSGKSTLLNILGGLDTPTSGTALWRDHDLSHASESELTRYRREHVGFVFQFYNLIPSLTARENVALVTEMAQHPMRPEEALAMVDLEERLDHYPAQLSGGEQQRVAIARALVHDPLLVLADEPTGNLDDANGERVLALLLELTRDAGRTLIMATHNPDIAPLAGRVLELHNGQLMEAARA